ncbi:UBP5 [Symbiodinium necroappetens]|uniref:Ubiquitin carboxyl-terminal hydrolase n=1 Tax=Symbiodinium necroappetens TaxID=1628268 RepID=A0A812J752_9DINO|nr:UBP5 [Symbiodinium necroappetens]
MAVGSTTAMKRSLSEHADYEIVPEDAWDLLYEWYGGGPPIKRRAIREAQGGVMVELFGLSLKAYRSSDMNGFPKEIIESKYATIRELKERLCEEMELDARDVRIWDYFDNKPFASLEEDLDGYLHDKRIMDNNPILLEERDANGEFTFVKDMQTSSQAAAVTSSGSGYYSSYNSYSSADVPMVGEPIQRGAVGLQNLGNTCFMNSSIQCLSNIPQLREYFLDLDKERLNRTAHKTQGKLAESFADLLKMMWRENTAKVAPRNFKYQVGQFAEQFSGYGQQDSMELIEYVLDGLKEDCNSVQGPKPYIELKEADGRPDEEVAREALAAYRQRNSSRVDDLFVGLFKSVVRCPEKECGRVSVTFDPFLSAKLSLTSTAEQRQTSFTLLLVRDSVKGYQQVKVRVNKEASVKELIQAAADEVGEGLEASKCILVEVWNKKVHQFIEENTCVDSIRAEDHLLLSEVSDATAFHVTNEQRARWGASGSSYSMSETEPPLPGEPTPSSSSSFGAVLNHRKASNSNSVWSSFDHLGVPILLAIRKAATMREMYAQVRRYMKQTLDIQVAPEAWRIVRCEKYSARDGTLIDAESDELLDLKGSREYFAIEWMEETSIPSLLHQDPFRHTSEEVSDGDVDLTHLLQLFVQDERLGTTDAWYCSRCKEHREAYKQLQFHHCPPVLVIQLKRFQYNRWSRERLNTSVSFPLEGLDLRPFCTASSKESFESPPIYDLAALSKHIGSLGGGHYVAFCRSSEDGSWYHFDDGSVRKCSEQEVSADKVRITVDFTKNRGAKHGSLTCSVSWIWRTAADLDLDPVCIASPTQACMLASMLRQRACVPMRTLQAARSKTTLIMGPPGGGKGTISKKLIKDFDFHHISSGDMLRSQALRCSLQTLQHMRERERERERER